MTTITDVTVRDLRFPTSRTLDGSDAMNPDPDYSAAALTLGTDDAELSGHSFVFTIGRGNDVQAAAVSLVAARLIGRDVEGLCEDPGLIARELTWDSQLRWLGPDKGVIHMAVGAVVNVVWDLRARLAREPLWLNLATMSTDDLVAQVDWTYLSDYLDPAEAREILEEHDPLRSRRRVHFEEHGLPAYTTSPGWLGYSDDKLARLCQEAAASGFQLIKLKVGASPADDMRRLSIARQAVGDSVELAVDANQRWDVETAIERIQSLSKFNLRWVEEPTHPDDVLGHATIAQRVAPTPIATGEHLANPVLAKQLLQAGGVAVLQLDAARVGGVNDLIAMTLLARKAGTDVIPHAGGVGLCEAVQHIAFFNAICLAQDPTRLALEYVGHLHDHMTDPVTVCDGMYQIPIAPGGSSGFTAGIEDQFGYPGGAEWQR